MNDKALRTLEYYKIIEQLESYAGSALGKEICKNLKPMTDLHEIKAQQKETSDALTRICQKGSVSFSGVTDIRGSLKRLGIGGTIGLSELLTICKLLEACTRVKAYSRRETDTETPDSLDDLFAAIMPLTPISTEIRRCIISEEEISDDASATLRQIRRSMKQTSDRVHTQLNAMVNGSVRSYLQDAVVTMRNGRYCLPVKAEYRGQVNGMIHDQSTTGSTLFIEPMVIVKLNNDLRELEVKETQEIDVILATLSEMVAVETETIAENLSLLTRLDVIFAKGNLSLSYQGSEPLFNTDGWINIKKGRHPLLDKNAVVPIDIRLGRDFQLLIITGPNTGGKTVSLKTVGLFTLMGQAGLHIPAFDKSELAMFEDVFADIGDEQSIEQSLSTFSSHMTNIVSILEQATERSLVLFDELGAGTDPTEGAALAIAILSTLHRRGVRTMATTHYSELKVFALSTLGIENGCCEFNVETLRPTYRLLIGIPGKSNAFAISSKLGLSDEIIIEAKSHLTEQSEDFEDIIASLEQRRIALEQEHEEIERIKRDSEILRKRFAEKESKVTNSREEILRKAREEAQVILRDAKDYADTTMRNFNKFGKAGISAKEMEQERERLRGKLSGVEKGLGLKKSKIQTQKIDIKKLKVGDTVRVLSLNLDGTISTLPNDKGNLYVQMGILRSQIHISDLELRDTPTITAPNFQNTGRGKMKVSKSASIGMEINLLGKTVDEAIAELDKYLDDAYLTHIPSVRVVHGKGTGALRKGVHNYLRRLQIVETFRLGEFGEGDSGVTIVEFKK